MREIASLDLCKELYELSGWGKDGKFIFYWYNDGEGWKIDRGQGQLPAYSLGYLLRKLPDNITIAVIKDVVHHKEKGKNFITNRYSAHNLGDIRSGWCDTPEDATCKLAIELFKQGVLK